MMIGLKRGTVKLVAYKKQWAVLFEKEKTRIAFALGGAVVDIQHIGSTSIPGIQAKPIIDISVGIRVMKDARKLVTDFEQLGYERRNDVPWKKKNLQLLFVKGPEHKRKYYVHVMRYKGAIWNHDILFRDFLRSNKKYAKQYESLKKKLAKQFANDRASYTESKSAFIHEILKMARR